MAGDHGLTHASLQARVDMASPAYEAPSDYDSAVSDFTGVADEELQRREIRKKAQELRIAETGRRLMEEHEKKRMEDHIQSTADGLFGGPEPEVIDIGDSPKKAKR